MTLRSIELTPISLGWKDARHRRGRPRLAAANEGNAILERFAELSRPFGTELGNETRSVRLG
jgi:poly-gamma-glutamate synthesis protein (capsule biosynthesis protein)